MKSYEVVYPLGTKVVILQHNVDAIVRTIHIQRNEQIMYEVEYKNNMGSVINNDWYYENELGTRV